MTGPTDGWSCTRTDTSTPGPTIGCTSAGVSRSPRLSAMRSHARRSGIRALEVDGEPRRRGLGHPVPSGGLQHHGVAHRRRRAQGLVDGAHHLGGQGDQPDGIEHGHGGGLVERRARRRPAGGPARGCARRPPTPRTAARPRLPSSASHAGVGGGPAQGARRRLHGVEHGHRARAGGGRDRTVEARDDRYRRAGLAADLERDLRLGWASRRATGRRARARCRRPGRRPGLRQHARCRRRCAFRPRSITPSAPTE